MVNSCFLCNKKASISDNISLHRFPKNVDIRTKWLNACGLTANDDVRRISICSTHFKTNEVCKSNIFGRIKSSIKRNAVPTLYLSNPFSVETSNKSPPNTPLTELFDVSGVANQPCLFFPDNNVPYVLEKSLKKCFEVGSIKLQMSNNSSINLDSSSQQSNLNQFMETPMSNSSSEDGNTGNGKSSSTYACDIDEFDPLRIDIKTEHIEIKEEPIGYENTGNYEDSKVKIETTCEPANCEESDIDSEFSSECIELGIYVTKELKKLKDYNSLAVAKQCIKSVILAAQNGLYKNGITPSVLPLPTDSVVKDEPIDQ